MYYTNPMKRLVFVIICVLCTVFLMGVAPQTQWVMHTVQEGETLAKIVRQYLPLTAAYTKKELVNSIKYVNAFDGTLAPGQVIKVPVAWDAPLKPRTVPKPKTFVATGVYMNPSSAGTRTILNTGYKLRLLGGNTVVFDAKDDLGAITFPSAIPAKYCPQEHYTPNIEELPKMIEYLHRMGVHVVARVVVLKDPIMARTHPEWCMNREKSWLDPMHPQVQEYLLTVIRQIVESGVDEIQLDYIRYFADKKTDASVAGMSRSDAIAVLLKKIHEVTAPRGVLLSMDMFGIVIWQRDIDVLSVGQDVNKLKPYVDIISPMLYPSHFSPGFDGIKNPADDPYRFVYDGIKRMKALVGDEVVIRPWLQAFPLHVTKGFGPGYIETQIRASKDAGGTGWLLWSPENRYTYSYAAMQNMKKPKSEVRTAKAPSRQKMTTVAKQADTKPLAATNQTTGVVPPAGTTPTATPKTAAPSLASPTPSAQGIGSTATTASGT